MKRIVKAVWSLQKKIIDPRYELDFAKDLKSKLSLEELKRLYSGYKNEDSDFALIMRRILMKSICLSFGDGTVIAPDVSFKHPETFKIGERVFIGSYTYLQGRFDGNFVVGDYTWIGPHCYFDARELKIGNFVGIGPGVKIITSEHTAKPINIPILKTELIIERVKIKDGTDIGTGTTILKGVTIGKGCLIGANSVINKDIPDYAVAVGSPAKIIRWRNKKKHKT